jgi:hypothetical protein
MERWLKTYYLTRALFSFAWAAAAVSVARHAAGIAAALLVCCPAWDALANLADGTRSGGLAGNRTQAVNAAVSLVAAAAVAIALPDMNRVLGVFGAWAVLSGLLQLGTALRRWKAHGAQWRWSRAARSRGWRAPSSCARYGRPRCRRSPPWPAMRASGRSTF